VWAAPIPLRRKVQATLHLTGYAVHLLLFALTLLYPLVVIFASAYPRFNAWCEIKGLKKRRPRHKVRFPM
jgi:hypothetical protein